MPFWLTHWLKQQRVEIGYATIALLTYALFFNHIETVELAPEQSCGEGFETIGERTCSPSLSSVMAVPASVNLTDKELQLLGFRHNHEASHWLNVVKPKIHLKYLRPQQTEQLLFSVRKHARQQELSSALVLAVIQVESNFDPYAISRVGALGLMQVMPFWKDQLGASTDNLNDIDTNIYYGTQILAHYLKRTKGDLSKALARYNGSYPKTWYSDRVLLAMEDHYP